MQQKNNSRSIRICAVCFALLIMLIAAATYYFACRGTEYRILDDAEIQQMSARSEYSTEAQRTLAESALMLVGKVNYFWGGKSYTVGWDDRWGKTCRSHKPRPFHKRNNHPLRTGLLRICALVLYSIGRRQNRND